MSEFSLNPDMQIEVTIHFLAKGSGNPLKGEAYWVKLFDKDLIGTDHLGESGLDDNGRAKISFSHSSFGEWNRLEKYPDFYFTLEKNAVEIYKSEVLENFDIKQIEEFKMGAGELIELGTYLIADQ